MRNTRMNLVNIKTKIYFLITKSKKRLKNRTQEILLKTPQINLQTQMQCLIAKIPAMRQKIY